MKKIFALCLAFAMAVALLAGCAGKDEQKANYLSYICSILNHRSSLKTYINRGFNEISGLSNPEQYHVKFDKEFNIYWTEASESLFYCLDDGERVPISESRLWKTLK